MLLSRLCSLLLGFVVGLNDFIEATLEHKELLWNMINFAFEDPVKALDGLGDLDILARQARELLRHREGLAEESLQLAGPLHRELILIAQLFHAQNGDDVLQVLVALQHALHLLGDAIVFLAHNVRIKDAAG